MKSKKGLNYNVKKSGVKFPTYLFLFLFSIFILSSSVIGLGTYPWVGGQDYDYNQGRGFFPPTTDIEFATRQITNPLQAPIVSDLNNDGVNEIIVLDGDTIKLYHGHGLEIVDGVSIPNLDRYSNMLAYDIDGDSLKEVIIVREFDEKIDIFEYNTTFILQNTVSYSSKTQSIDGQTVISCGGVDSCMLVYSQSRSVRGAGVSTHIRALPFSSTAVRESYQLRASPSTPYHIFCMPKIRSMPYIDYDGNGEKEYVVSFLQTSSSGNENYYISYISVNATNDITGSERIDKEMGNLKDGIFNCEEETVNAYITSPIVYDFDGASSNGLETVIGIQKDADEFKIHSWRSDGTQLDTYPAFFDADGIIISNPIIANIDPDSEGSVDFCVMGYQDNIGEIDLLCASEQGGGLFDPESDEFEYDVSGLYNITKEYDFYNNMIHAVQHSSETTGGQDLNEIITPYGIFTIDYEGNNELLMLYENPKADAVLYSLDIEQVGRDDLLALTPTNLWYIDDGYSKSGAEIDAYTINPCIDSTWKINSTVSVTITVTDPDLDLVSAKAVLYEGESFEQETNWTTPATSGTTFTFSFMANRTIGTGVLTLYGRDDDMVGIVDNISLSYSVGNDGVSFGDCSTSVDVITSGEEEQEGENLTLDMNDNAIYNAIESVDEAVGTGFSTAIWWFLFMVVVAVSIWNVGGSSQSSDKTSVLGITALVETLLFIVGLKLGFFGVGTLIIVIVIGLGVLAFKWSPFGSAGG